MSRGLAPRLIPHPSHSKVPLGQPTPHIEVILFGNLLQPRASRPFDNPIFLNFITRNLPRDNKLPIMPAIRHSSKRKPPPEGFSDIEDDLLIFSNKMKDAQNKPPPQGAKHQAQWEVFQISHQRSRYVYDLYYEKEAISKQLYDWLLKNGYADAMLIAKWKKQGYEKVSRVCAPAFP